MTRHVLILGENTFPFHRIEAMGPLLSDAIGEEATVEITTDREMLSALDSYDVLVDYLTDSSFTDEQLDGLHAFIENGGGYFPIHCASDLTNTASDDPDELFDSREEPFPELRALIGGHFLTHPEQSEFEVIIEADHPITDGVTDFTVFDEPYQVDVTDDITVLATMNHPDLDAYPVLWTRTRGDGRICYLSLGHTEEALTNEAVQRIIQNALGWLTAH